MIMELENVRKEHVYTFGDSGAYSQNGWECEIPETKVCSPS